VQLLLELPDFHFFVTARPTEGENVRKPIDRCVSEHVRRRQDGTETKDDANKPFDEFLEKCGAKYGQACDCLMKDRDVLTKFYDFPAEHWSHLRTTNPIESTFATICLRHRKVKAAEHDERAWR